MPEIWKTIAERPKYEVSNRGRVRREGRILRPRTHKAGYKFVLLQGREYYVHRIVAAAFLGDIPPGFQVNHLDKNPKNNVVTNLEICTPKENLLHARWPEWHSAQYKLFATTRHFKPYSPGSRPVAQTGFPPCNPVEFFNDEGSKNEKKRIRPY